MPGQPGPGPAGTVGAVPRGPAERAVRSIQRAVLGAAMTLAAVVAERRIRRALRRDGGRGRASG
jgi:hypothetical protein